jgi:hypothetical protein
LLRRRRQAFGLIDALLITIIVHGSAATAGHGTGRARRRIAEDRSELRGRGRSEKDRAERCDQKRLSIHQAVLEGSVG